MIAPATDNIASANGNGTLAASTFQRLESIADAWLDKLSYRELRVMVKLLSHARNGSGEMSIGVAEIARKTNIDERNVQRALASLAARGILPVVDAGGGRNRPAVRRIVLPKVDRAARNTPATDAVVSDDETPANETVVNDASGEINPGYHVHETPAVLSANPGYHVHETPATETTGTTYNHVEPRMNHVSRGSAAESVGPPAARRNGAGRKQAAEEIYLAYPKHVGKAKALAAIGKALAGLDDKPAGWLLERTRKYAAFRKAVEDRDPAAKRFTPHPSTWFSQERFNDDDDEWLIPANGRAGEFAEPERGLRVLNGGNGFERREPTEKELQEILPEK